ncbi:hypothetical protein [Rathayibacter soli]|uniref:hypothetical protein n=1 Tax=Rathayibacter soli TaxID=3144168 RepID=UPI0027E41C64|nr:hypothetical protein [Glaciibacter superstes]
MRNRFRILTAAGLVAASIVGVAGAATAATASTATATSATTATEWSVRLPALTETNIPQLVCPASKPFLINQELSPARLVPRGVQVIESGFGIFVTIPSPVHDGSGTAGGISSVGAVATNWDFFSTQDLTIKLHCTSDRDASYPVA